MIARSAFLLLVCFWTSLAFGQETMDEVRAVDRKLVPEAYDDWAPARRLTWIAKALEGQPTLTETYILNRLLLHERIAKDDTQGAIKICQEVRAVRDDFSFRLRCVDVLEGVISHEQSRSTLLEILQDARRLNRPGEIVDALGSIAWIQSQDGDISEALANYAEALEIVPKEDERMRFNVLFNLATNYIVHGNDEYIRKGITLLEEIKVKGAERARDKSLADASLFLGDSQMAAFNLGIAYTLHLHEYAKAIPEFEYSKAMGDSNRVEALTFSALAAAEIGDFPLARKFLAEINGEASRFPLKEAYLQCYRSLAIRHWDSKTDIDSCFRLSMDTTLEVLLDVNKRLVRLKNQPEELEGLRAYVRMYEEKIEPEYKKRVAKAASNTELKRLESEARLKDEKIALGERIKILLYIVMVITLLLFGLVIQVLFSRRIIHQQAQDIQFQKENLQHVLDSIDEGIVAIDIHGRIAPIYSRHASEILQKNPVDMSVVDLLIQVGMEGDKLAAAQEVFRAVLGENSLTWDMNAGSLPTSGSINGRPFQYFWSPIIKAGKTTEVILSIRDASATLALEQETRTRGLILAVVNAGTTGQKFIWDLDRRLTEMEQGIQKDAAQHTLRLAHTMKGEARGLGFTGLQNDLHAFEQSLLQENFSRSREILQNVRKTAGDLHAAFTLIKGDDQRSRGHPILALAQSVLGDAHRRLREAGFDLISDLHINWVDLCEAEVNVLRDLLVHGVANSIDHGYLLAKKRNQPCDPLARLSVQLHAKGDDIHFSIIDHGIGIDWQALEEIARKRNWTPPKDSDLADIVFFDRVSTVTEIQVSKTSGRGIGMAAVAEAVKSLNGSIKFGPGFNHRGARLDIKWNHKKVVENQVAPAQHAS